MAWVEGDGGDGPEADTPPPEGDVDETGADAPEPAPPERAEGDGPEASGLTKELLLQALREGLDESGWPAARVLAPALQVSIRGLAFRVARARLLAAAAAIPDAEGRRQVTERALASGGRARRGCPPRRGQAGGA